MQLLIRSALLGRFLASLPQQGPPGLMGKGSEKGKGPALVFRTARNHKRHEDMMRKRCVSREETNHVLAAFNPFNGESNKGAQHAFVFFPLSL